MIANEKMDSPALPTYFISHGGGPWPWLKDQLPDYAQLQASLQDIPRQVGAAAKAVLMISAHWEADDFALTGHAHPPMIYDYGGFPPHTYQIKYSAPGAPSLANSVRDLLNQAGFASHVDAQRGFDHGMFAPMFAMYPQADMPVVQLSLKRNYDPHTHFAMGRALASLRSQGVVIIGSGLSYHNLRAIFSHDRSAATTSRQFDSWLQDTLLLSVGSAREKKLMRWDQAPAAREAHPREDHLMPLMVAVGAAEDDPATRIYFENFTNSFVASSYRFG